MSKKKSLLKMKKSKILLNALCTNNGKHLMSYRFKSKRLKIK